MWNVDGLRNPFTSTNSILTINTLPALPRLRRAIIKTNLPYNRVTLTTSFLLLRFYEKKQRTHLFERNWAFNVVSHLYLNYK